MDFLYLIFYGCLRLRFLDVETNPGSRRPVPAVCRILCSNVRGLAGNLSDLIMASSQYDILLCSETLVSDMRHVSEVLVSCFCRPVLLCRGKMPRARGIAAYVREGYQAEHSKLWWMVVKVNWLTLYQECHRAVFWARYCSSCTLRSSFPFWKIS